MPRMYTLLVSGKVEYGEGSWSAVSGVGHASKA